MTITTRTVRALNEEMQEIPIEEARIAELPVELNALHGAAVALRAGHDFDREPADFRRVLHALKG